MSLEKTSAEARMQTLAKLILGHAVECVGGNDTHIRFRVGDHVFDDKRSGYPSEKLVANIALAIEAQGYSRNAFDIGDLPNEVLNEIVRHGRYPSPEMIHTFDGERIG